MAIFWSSRAFKRQPRIDGTEKRHYFLRLGLKEFLEFCLINFEVIFWTTTDTKTLEP